MNNDTSAKVVGIIYRDNDAFKIFVPKIVQVLEARGYTVNVSVVNKGAGWSEIRKAVAEWKNAMPAGSKELSDRTCEVCGDIKYGGQLDFIVGDCVSGAFLGVNHGQVDDYLKEQSSSLETAKAVFQKAILAVGEKIGVPAVVRVRPDNLNDHQPFVSYEHGRDPYAIRMEIDEAVEHVQSWVREIYPDCKFDCERVGLQSTWTVGDRHSWAKEYKPNSSGEGNLSLSFRLPVENMILDLASLGLLPPVNIDDEMIALISKRLPE